MEILASLGFLASLLIVIVLIVLGIFLPWFVYRIHCNVKAIRKSLENMERHFLTPGERGSKTCPQCGKELRPGVTFCNDCGISVE